MQVVRGVLLKGDDAALVAPHLWPLAAYLAAVAAIALFCYRRTLD